MDGADQDALSVGQAAELCRLGRSTIRRAVREGMLAGWRTSGGHLRVRRSDCVAFARSLGQVAVVPSEPSPAAPERGVH
jgi:excisionase family DNA binding protein